MSSRRANGVLAALCASIAALALTATSASAATQPFKVTVAGPGTVYDNYGYINCTESGGACEAEIEEGTPVTLYAYSTERSAFSHWQGCESENGTECNLTIGSAATEVSAEFEELPQQSLTVTAEGPGTVTGTSPGGDFTPIECGNGATTCAETYNEGATVILFANHNERTSFAGWQGCTNVIGPTECEVTLTAATEVKAKFAPKTQEQLTVTSTEGSGTGTVTGTSPGGDFTPIDCVDGNETCTAEYNQGATITLTAAPVIRNRFVGWTGCTHESGDQCEVEMTAAKSVNADFAAIPQQTLELEVQGAGEVTSFPSGIFCPGACSEHFGTEGPESTVTLTASAEPYSRFEGWSAIEGSPGTCTAATSPCEVTMGEAHKLQALFLHNLRTVTVTVAGGGSVSADQGTISGCTSAGGPSCSGTYDEGQELALTDTPALHQEFEAWSGPGHGACAATTTCHLVIGEADVEITATDTPILRSLTLTAFGEGEVTSEPSAIACTAAGSGCQHSFEEPQIVKLTATPAAHNRFLKWSGPGAGSCTAAAVCELEMSIARAVAAEFAPITHTLTIAHAGTGSGAVTCNGAPCAPSYDEHATITLAAFPAAGSTFAGFSGGGCSGTAACVITLEADTVLTAGFTLNSPPAEGRLSAAASAAVSAARAALKLACSSGPCSGKLKLTAKLKPGRKAKSVVIGQGSYQLAAGGSLTLEVRLSAPARKLLSQGKAIKATLTGADGLDAAVQLKAAKRKRAMR